MAELPAATTGAQEPSEPQAAPLHHEHEMLRPLSSAQMMFYGTGGIAGGLIFTLMNNALPLFLLGYTMPLGLPHFFSPGAPIPATFVALLTNERSIFGGLVQPFVGILSDRTHTRIGKRSPYILFGGTGTALCIAALAFHPSFWFMILLVTLGGAFLFVAVGPYASLLADIAPVGQRGRIGGLTALAGVIGAIAISVLSSLFWDDAKWLVFVAAGAGVILSLLVVAFGVREPHGPVATTHPHHHRRERGLAAETLHDRPLALYILSMGIYWIGAGAASPFVTRFGVKELGVKERESFALLIVIVLATAVGAVISGVLADRLGKKRVLVPSLVLFAVAALLGSQVQNMGQALPVMLLVGLGNSVPTALQVPMLADLVPRHRAGAFMGFASMLWSVAQPAGSLLAGTLVDLTNSYRGVFIMAAVCMLLAALVLTRVPRTAPRHAGGGGTTEQPASRAEPKLHSKKGDGT